MLYKIQIALLLLLFSFCAIAQEQSPVQTEEEYRAWALNIWESLNRQSGDIEIPGAKATLRVPETHYFLDSQGARKVLEEVWGNPPSESILGMIFPAESTPFDPGAWAVTVEYEEDGYVEDKDAGDIDYQELLEQMKVDTKAGSDERAKQGYEPIELVGWAAQPYYDSATKKLHWAKEIKFGAQEVNTLNYNIRVLGRKGVLVLNFIAGMNQLPLIETNLGPILAMAEFDQGSTYFDFDPDLDTVAAYGLGALVAGKVLAKTGLIAVALVFLKKFGIIIVIALGALFKGLFSRKKKAQKEV